MKASKGIPRRWAVVFAAILFVLFLISAVQWGIGTGGIDKTGSIYDIREDFKDDNYATPQPDIYSAGLSVTNNDVTQMQVDSSFLGTLPPISGAAALESATAVKGINSIDYSDVVYSGLLAHSGDLANQSDGSSVLTAGGPASHTAGGSGTVDINGDATVAAPGSQPYGLDRRTPLGGGWMGDLAANAGASPGASGQNDKFEPQNGTTDETVYNVTAVPEPSTLLLVCAGLAVGLLRKRSRCH